MLALQALAYPLAYEKSHDNLIRLDSMNRKNLLIAQDIVDKLPILYTSS
jgi:hypothetical protein